MSSSLLYTPRRAALAVVITAVLIALASARPEAGGWNDGSRLATVEALVDRHTLAIDDSIFVQVPKTQSWEPSPYTASVKGLRQFGTWDKLRINRQYYSDKSPVPSLLLAGQYQLWQWLTGLKAAQRPDWFCFLMTLGSSGLAYVAAVGCTFALGRRVGLDVGMSVILSAAMALSSVALPYAQYTNGHILMLGAVAPLMLGLTYLSDANRLPVLLLIGLGVLTGLAYTMDLGVGPVLVMCVMGLTAYRGWHRKRIFFFVYPALLLLGAAPWLVLHHAVNYSVGGTLIPANAVAEYLAWPGSPFTPETMTGGFKHATVLDLSRYALDLLFGRRGFLTHNLPLIPAFFLGCVLMWKCGRERPEIMFCGVWAAGTWMLYAINSNNASGACCSIRWFVPLLAPGYYVLALGLRQYPTYTKDFIVLAGWGALLGVLMARTGPWTSLPPAMLWVVVALAMLHWSVVRIQAQFQSVQTPAAWTPPTSAAA